MTTSQAAYPLTTARALALHTQGLDVPPPYAAPDAETIYDTVDRVGWVQIDTLQMVRRSQYIALWSRLGPYDTSAFDKLIFGDSSIHGDNDRRLFEYWMHAACIIPLSLYRFTIPTMRRYATPTGSRRSRWITAAENMQLLDEVLKHVRENGLARSADFERADGRRGTWWDWKPAKIALEHLYNTGTLTIANRVNFQRIYGITETVLPDWVDTTPPSEEEAYLTLLDKSARALGICAPMQVPDYFHMKRTPAKPSSSACLTKARCSQSMSSCTTAQSPSRSSTAPTSPFFSAQPTATSFQITQPSYPPSTASSGQRDATPNFGVFSRYLRHTSPRLSGYGATSASPSSTTTV